MPMAVFSAVLFVGPVLGTLAHLVFIRSTSCSHYIFIFRPTYWRLCWRDHRLALGVLDSTHLRQRGVHHDALRTGDICCCVRLFFSLIYAMFLTFPFTFYSLLKRRAEKLRAETGNPAYRTATEIVEADITIGERVQIALIRPFGASLFLFILSPRSQNVLSE